MLDDVRGIGDTELITLTLTGKQVKYLYAAISYALTKSPMRDATKANFLKSIRAKFKKLIG